MAPKKYRLRASSYPWKGYDDYTYETEWFALFVVRFVYCLIKYPIVDTMFRANRRMDRIDARGDAE